MEGFAERYMEAQKSSKAMQHFLPKRTSSSAASSRPRPAPTQHHSATPEPRPPEGRRDRGRSRRQGTWPKIALDGRHHVMVIRACVSALARWRDLLWLKQGMTLDTAHRRKVVTTDASNKGWGALCEGKPTFNI